MTNAHSFPLRRLPFLAQELVIQRMMIKEQLDFSTLSKLSKWTVRASTSRLKFDMLFDFRVSSFGSVITDSSLTQRHSFKMNGTSGFPSLSELTELITTVSGSFKNLGVSLQIWGGSSSRTSFELIPVIKRLNASLKSVMVVSDLPNDELCELALKTCKNAKELHIECKISPNFQPQELQVFDSQLLYIHFASWVSLDHLVNSFMNCDEVCLSRSKMSINDVNQFFKTWVAGSKMGYFRWTYVTSLESPSVLPAVLDGIPSVAVKKATIQDDAREFEDDECFVIEQVGGIKAIVYREYRGFVPVIMTTEFSLD